MNRLAIALSVGFSAAIGVTACASQVQTIPGTTIHDNSTNRAILDVVEQYRVAVERQDTAALLLMASKQYWEDGGTPTGGDDYGYDGLRQVLQKRFPKASDIRYSLRYVNLYRRCKADGDPATNDGCRAYVDVLIDASYSVTDAMGQAKRPDMRDQNQLVLEWNGTKWLFLSGM
ncbi:MAG: hypothetical protein MJE77_01080 [Proteobacteria bacterium]|nr:hypothetical protein [Pseudomonadota bacterium]